MLDSQNPAIKKILDVEGDFKIQNVFKKEFKKKWQTVMKNDRQECEQMEKVMGIQDIMKIGRATKKQSLKHLESQKHKDQYG